MTVSDSDCYANLQLLLLSGEHLLQEVNLLVAATAILILWEKMERDIEKYIEEVHMHSSKHWI